MLKSRATAVPLWLSLAYSRVIATSKIDPDELFKLRRDACIS